MSPEVVLRPENEFIANHFEEVKQVLSESVIDRVTCQPEWDEIEDIMSYVQGRYDRQFRHRQYVFAEESGLVVGMVGCTNPERDTVDYWDVDQALTVELVNFFIRNDFRGKGVGRKLFHAVCNHARELGAKFLVLDSGPRYEHTAWGFYDKVCDQSGILVNKYGEGINAKTWIKTL